LSIVIGVVAYVTIPFLRDVAFALSLPEMAHSLDTGFVRVGLALLLVWFFAWINIRGAKSYEKTIIPLMILMFLMGGIVIFAGFSFSKEDFAASF
jgi:basic amino acid/polyamine antiporter, APA family